VIADSECRLPRATLRHALCVFPNDSPAPLLCGVTGTDPNVESLSSFARPYSKSHFFSNLRALGFSLRSFPRPCPLFSAVYTLFSKNTRGGIALERPLGSTVRTVLPRDPISSRFSLIFDLFVTTFRINTYEKRGGGGRGYRPQKLRSYFPSSLRRCAKGARCGQPSILAAGTFVNQTGKPKTRAANATNERCRRTPPRFSSASLHIHNLRRPRIRRHSAANDSHFSSASPQTYNRHLSTSQRFGPNAQKLADLAETDDE
jgi:hypothetical protein